MSISYPQPLKFHKKIAQLQIDLVRPKEEMEGDRKRVKEGCLFLSLAKPLGDTGRMDWANKINMKDKTIIGTTYFLVTKKNPRLRHIKAAAIDIRDMDSNKLYMTVLMYNRPTTRIYLLLSFCRK